MHLHNMRHVTKTYIHDVRTYLTHAACAHATCITYIVTANMHSCQAYTPRGVHGENIICITSMTDMAYTQHVHLECMHGKPPCFQVARHIMSVGLSHSSSTWHAYTSHACTLLVTYMYTHGRRQRFISLSNKHQHASIHIFRAQLAGID